MRGVFAIEMEHQNCAPPFSFYREILHRELKSHNEPVHRFFALMRKMGATCLFRETIAFDPQIEAEFAEAKACGTDVPVNECEPIRYTVFRSAKNSSNPADHEDADLLGYLVLLKMKDNRGRTLFAYVLESVVREPAYWVGNGPSAPEAVVVCNHYLHCAKIFQTTLGEKGSAKHFSLYGSFFCQQSRHTHVCAQAALRMAVTNSISSKDHKIFTYKEINKALGKAAVRNQIAEDGFAAPTILSQDLIAAIPKLGLESVALEFDGTVDVPFDQFVYPFIESGQPVLLGVFRPKEWHVFTLLGHTLDTDRWMPQARVGYGRSKPPRGKKIKSPEQIPHLMAAEWVDHFVAHDDNYGMYVTIPGDALKSPLMPVHNKNLTVGLAIGLLPAAVTSSPYAVEIDAIEKVRSLLLRDNIRKANANPWWEDLTRSIVARTLLQTRTSYLEQMEMLKADAGEGTPLTDQDYERLRALLPDRFWVTEITIPHLYMANRAKLGDVISAYSPNSDEPEQILAWFPGVFVEREKTLRDWSINWHVPLLRPIRREEKGPRVNRHDW